MHRRAAHGCCVRAVPLPWQTNSLHYPLLTLGGCDAQNTGVPIAVALSSHEATEAYSRFVCYVRRASGSAAQPTHTVHDTATALFAAVTAELPGTKSFLCFFRVMQSLERLTAAYTDDLTKTDKEFIVQKVHQLRHITNMADADEALALFRTVARGPQ